MKLDGKAVIVTGGAGGIGRGISTACAAEGAGVLIVDLDQEAGDAAVREITEAVPGARVAFLAADIGAAGTAEAVRDAAVAEFGRIDVLVNNAHASRQAPLLEHTDEMFELSFGTGFFATYRLMRACHAHLAERGGSIVNFASGAGLNGQPNQASYAAAKEAIRGLSRVAAHEWARDGIRVNLVSPIARTAGVEAWSKTHAEQYERMLGTIPLGRLGDPREDIAPVVVFLACDDSRYMTGQTLMADGGTVMLR
ncbi:MULTISPECIES: SDR family NAD(P)-dependent oxidoreductase [Saccharopolyspora]|uniref:SDR family NAD(P)-dependent oxidoreductase n=1 Tax=Saccharopolyspora cebuensis TaxID=418759 RepID=A0ABV4CBP7_9PSEU